MTNTTFSKRLKLILEWARLKQVDFAREIEVPVTTLSGATRGIHKNISQTVVRKIALRYPQIDIDWLLTGKGTMLKNPNTDRTTQTVVMQVRGVDFEKYAAMLKDNEQVLTDVDAVYYTTKSKEPLRDFEIGDDSLSEPPSRLHKGDFVRGKLLRPELYNNEALIGKLCIVVTDDVHIRFVSGFNEPKTKLILTASNKLYNNIEINITTITEMWLYDGFISSREIRL